MAAESRRAKASAAGLGLTLPRSSDECGSWALDPFGTPCSTVSIRACKSSTASDFAIGRRKSCDCRSLVRRQGARPAPWLSTLLRVTGVFRLCGCKHGEASATTIQYGWPPDRRAGAWASTSPPCNSSRSCRSRSQPLGVWMMPRLSKSSKSTPARLRALDAARRTGLPGGRKPALSRPSRRAKQATSRCLSLPDVTHPRT
jgi:hypothetical protein